MATSPSKKTAATKTTTAKRAVAGAATSITFARKLVLNQWLLSLFGIDNFKTLASLLKDAPEGHEPNGIHQFHHLLVAGLRARPLLPDSLLLEYDQNIVAHTNLLNTRRLVRGQTPTVWKYFQYLALLFTEIYLDKFFRDPHGLLAALNAQIARYNADKSEADQLKPLNPAEDPGPQLNKLAFWMATGSGKTLLMHANILQYQHYLDHFGRRKELNRIILLTPNERLSAQHLEDFRDVGIQAEIFNKDSGSLFAGRNVEIIEVGKLSDESKVKTVAVDAFEDNNLLLVDEGHRGAASGGDGAWMTYRNALCENGFSFEYSATFPQAVKGNDKLGNVYARATLFDYSYRYFHEDGFGKDYQILNLDAATETHYLHTYLVGCLLSHYQQQRLYRDDASALKKFQIAKPLWVFVGNSVTASTGKKEVSDIVAVLKFFARYIANRKESIACISAIQKLGLIAADGNNIFRGLFRYLDSLPMTAEQIFDDTLATLFHAPHGGHLYVENLTGADGEIALKVNADSDKDFGLINVSGDTKLVELLEAAGIEVGKRKVAESQFAEVKKDDSPINVLIGSKKFAEGWSSWRVSTLGLMNMATSEGAQAIQLFGRGVRLKGFDGCLKRSGSDHVKRRAGEIPTHIQILETLGVFGISADYMANFRKILEEEDVPVGAKVREFVIPVSAAAMHANLHYPGLPDKVGDSSTKGGYAFRKEAPVPSLLPPTQVFGPSLELLVHRVQLNWYPKIESLRSRALKASSGTGQLDEKMYLGLDHVAFLDLDSIWFELERFKADRGWYNLNLPREVLGDLLVDQTWYELTIPKEELAFGSFDKVRVWTEVATSLLKNYISKIYEFRKDEWEATHRVYRTVQAEDRNLTLGAEKDQEPHYTVKVSEEETGLVADLASLEKLVQKKQLGDWASNGLRTVVFDRHLYTPLLVANDHAPDSVRVVPMPLNEGEGQFVEDLAAHYRGHSEFYAGKELYVMRNSAKIGVGFFEAGNFYPDFIVWLLCDSAQHVIFVDPKGIDRMDWTDRKFEFHVTIKEIERELADPAIRLHSFIVPNTRRSDMTAKWKKSVAEMRERHILFQAEDKATYIQTMFDIALQS